jgi:hypothetical protein
MEITVAGSSHNCRYNDGHRIRKGMRRLTIKEDRAKLNYCLACAKAFLAQGLLRLQELQGQVDTLLGEAVEHSPKE